MAKRFPHADVRVVTFGAPRAGNEKFACAFASLIGTSLRFQYNRDIVPHVPSPLFGWGSPYITCNCVTDHFQGCAPYNRMIPKQKLETNSRGRSALDELESLPVPYLVECFLVKQCHGRRQSPSPPHPFRPRPLPHLGECPSICVGQKRTYFVGKAYTCIEKGVAENVQWIDAEFLSPGGGAQTAMQV